MKWETICEILNIPIVETCEELEDRLMALDEMELEDAIEFWEHIYDYDY